MSKYLLEVEYTLEGVRGLKSEGGSARVAAASALIEGLGGKVESFYFGFGATDVFVIVDMPDLRLSGGGGARRERWRRGDFPDGRSSHGSRDGRCRQEGDDIPSTGDLNPSNSLRDRTTRRAELTRLAPSRRSGAPLCDGNVPKASTSRLVHV
ncbi:MAG: GYD domain-containing protein [Acidimicrobiales bacterium]